MRRDAATPDPNDLPDDQLLKMLTASRGEEFARNYMETRRAERVAGNN
jgi:hypothetical protein